MPDARITFSARDLIAGLSVALVVIPQSLAYADIAQLPAVTGLYAAALPALAAAPFASSRYLQTGPVAMTALLSFGALSTLATPRSDEYIQLALLLALVVGVVRVALGVMEAGAITNYMSPPVILGFTTAAAILISASQLPSATGITQIPDGLIERLFEVLSDPGAWNWQAIGLAASVVVVVVGGRRIHPIFPGVLIAVSVGLVIGATSGYTAALVGPIDAGFPPFSLSLPWSRLPDLLVPGVVIATIGFAEATAISRTFALQDRERWDASQELVSQGVANLAAGISGGFPVGGSFSRSSINRLSGAQTRWSGAVTGVLVLGFMPIAGVMADLPQAVLAAIVIIAVFPLIRVDEMIRLARVSRGQAVVAGITAAATLVLAPRIDLAVLLGVVAAGSLHLYRESSRVRIIATATDGTLILEPEGVLYYGSAGLLYDTLTDELERSSEIAAIRLDLMHLGRIDYTGFGALKSFAGIVRAAELELDIVNVPPHAQGLFDRSGGL